MEVSFHHNNSSQLKLTLFLNKNIHFVEVKLSYQDTSKTSSAQKIRNRHDVYASNAGQRKGGLLVDMYHPVKTSANGAQGMTLLDDYVIEIRDKAL